ncbi:hypothetical protein MMC06_000659 [Schaereria dolodes]|nr:hypothetical protein [Schaereria dolodes]
MALRFNIPPVTRVLLALLAGVSLVYQAVRYRDLISQSSGKPRHISVIPYISLVPQLVIYYPWVLLTSTLAEQNIATLIIAGVTILYGGKYLERAWGSAEFGKFLLLVTLIPNVVASFVYILWFAITRADTEAFTTIQGSISMQAAFLVAFKQLVPEHTVTILKGLVQVRVKHFPAVFLATNTISGFVFGTDTASVLSWLGFLTSWTYLRFYKVQPDLSGASTGGSTLRGDASETFAFAYFWPDVVHAPVAALADGIYNLLVALKICTPFSAEAVESGNEQATARGEGGLPSLLNHGGARGASGQREEAERRRALALRALDQRLQAAAASRQQPITSASAPPLADSVEKATKNPSGF